MSDGDLKQRDLLADTLDIWRESRAPLSVDGEKLTCRVQRREHRLADVYENLVSKTITSSARTTSVSRHKKTAVTKSSSPRLSDMNDSKGFSVSLMSSLPLFSAHTPLSVQRFDQCVLSRRQRIVDHQLQKVLTTSVHHCGCRC